MLKRFQRGIAIMLSLAAAMMFYTTAPAAQAGLLGSAKVTLSVPRAGISSNYEFSFTTTAATTIKGIKMAWKSNASATNDDPSPGMVAPTLSAQPTGSGIDTDTGTWTIDTTDTDTGIVYIVNSSADHASAGTVVYTISSVTNPTIVTSGTDGCL